MLLPYDANPHQLVASGRPSVKPAADWTPTSARSWSSRERRGAGVGARGAHARADLVDEVLDAGAGRVEVHPRGRDALLVEPLPGPVVRRLGGGPVGDGAGRGHPEGDLVRAARRSPRAGRRATRGCPRTTSRSSPTRRPAARASATSRGCRTPPSAQTCLPSSRRGRGALAARPRTAAGRRRSSSAWCTWRPGPTPTLTMSAPASISCAGALGGDDVARHDRDRRRQRADRARAPRASGPGGRARCRRRGSRRRPRAAGRPCRPRRRSRRPRRRPGARPVASTAGS